MTTAQDTTKDLVLEMDRVSELEDKKRARKTKNLILDTFIRGFESQPLVIDEFDDRLWAVTVDRATVMADGELTFRFKDGSEINNAKVLGTSLLNPG